MSKLIIMRGLPASGKSTEAERVMRESGNFVRVNKDLLRTMLHFDKFTNHNESLTRNASRALVAHFLSNNVNVIVDDTNLNPGTFTSWSDLGKEFGATVQCIEMNTTVGECLARDAVREKQVGAHVIQKMALQHKGYLKGQKVVVCDIDGTIADCTHRLQYAQGESKDWDKFFSLMASDTPRTDVIKQLSDIASQHKARVLFVSARPETYRAFTLHWLKKHLDGSGIDHHSLLLIMRESNDKRQDTFVKGDIYSKYLKDLDIVAVFDDRPSVIRMWRELGLNVIDVGKGIEF